MNVISLRKAGILILAVVLLLSLSAAAYADVAAISASYPYGISSVVDDQAQAKQLLMTEWEAWKNNYVSTNGYRRVLSQGNDTTSDSMGFGLLFSVYFNEQTLFDEFFAYVKRCYDSNGLMHWKTKDGTIVGQNSSTDADQNIALALIFADKMWASDGEIDYKTEVTTMLSKIKQYDFSATANLKPGDNFSDPRNPGYLTPGLYKIFRDFTGLDFWNTATYNAYSLLNKSRNATTGLVPNWCNGDGMPSNSYLPGGDDFGYDAIQFIWKTAVAYSWYGHEDAKALCSKPLSFFNNIGATNIVDGYKLNGISAGSYHSAAFVACAAAGTMTGTDKQLAKTFYDECLATKDNNYYGDTLRLLTLMYMTGNLQNLYQNGKQIMDSTSTTPVVATQPQASQGDAAASSGASAALGSDKTVLTISNMPIAVIFEEMGGTIEWNDIEQKVTIRWNGMTIELWNGKKEISINGVKKEVDVAPNIRRIRAMLSLPTSADSPECVIHWEGGTAQIENITNVPSGRGFLPNIQVPTAPKINLNPLDQNNIPLRQ